LGAKVRRNKDNTKKMHNIFSPIAIDTYMAALGFSEEQAIKRTGFVIQLRIKNLSL
jgi:hypothetical protein